MFVRKLVGYNRRQFVVHRFHLGGLYGAKSYLKRYLFGFRNDKIVYCLLYQYFFTKQVMFILSNSLRTYYDKVLFINSHYGYVFIFRRLCQILDMPYLYTKWVFGTLSNIVFFYKNVSRVQRNHLEGIYDMAFVPALTLNLNGLYNLFSLKEGRELTSVVSGILDYDVETVKGSKILFDRDSHLNYFFLGNDDNVKSLNYIMFLTIVAIFYRKLYLYTIFAHSYKRVGFVPMYFKKDMLPNFVLSGAQGGLVYFFKNFGSGKFLKKFYWYRHLRDYYFFPSNEPGDYEKLTQQFLSLYVVSRKKRRVLFFKTWQKKHRNFFFFNLQDKNFLQHLHMLLWNLFIKNTIKVNFFPIKGRIKPSSYRDPLCVIYFFLYQNFYYSQLSLNYGSILFNVNLNISLSSQYRYYDFAFAFNNITNYKILSYYNCLFRGFFHNRQPSNLTLNFFEKLYFLYFLLYEVNLIERFAALSFLKKRIVRYERKYFWTKVDEGSHFKIYNKGARFFFNTFSKMVKKKKSCFIVSRGFKRLKKPKVITDFLYYYQHYIYDIKPFWRTIYFKIFKRMLFIKPYSLSLKKYKRFRKSSFFCFFFYKPVNRVSFDSYLFKYTSLL